MDAHRLPALMHNRLFQVIVTWLWFVVFPLSVVGLLIGVGHIDIATGRQWYRAHPYIQAYFEAVLAGLLPLFFVLIDKEPLSYYGLSRKKLLQSVGVSLLVVALRFLESYLRSHLWVDVTPFAASPGFPWNIWHALWGIFANGPLEVFFFVWLVVKTDQLFKSEEAILSKGFLVTLVLFSVAHIMTTQDVINAGYVLVIWLLLGLVFKVTKNAVGPMIAWILINGMVWPYILLLVHLP